MTLRPSPPASKGSRHRKAPSAWETGAGASSGRARRTRAANTGKIGDGKVFVMELETALRIRTGEVDAAAITG